MSDLTVECPKCQTRFKLNAARLHDEAPSLRCSRCQYLFSLPRIKKQPAPRPPRPRRGRGEDKQLKLGGDEWSLGDLRRDPRAEAKRTNGADSSGAAAAEGTRGAATTAPVDDEGRDPQATVTEAGDTQDAEAPRQAGANGARRPALPDDVDDEPRISVEPSDDADSEPEPDLTFGEPEVELTFDDEPAEEIRPARKRPAERAAKPRVKGKPPAKVARERGFGWVSFAALVAVLYAVVALAMVTRPAAAKRVLGSLAPFADLDETALLGRDIRLTDIRAHYQRIKEDRRSVERRRGSRKDIAFVISGTATSVARQSLRDVQIRGRLLGSGGEVLAEKSVYSGFALSAEVLGTTDAFGVSVLERIPPPERFILRPGRSNDFVIAFVEPPLGVASYSVEVVAASAASR